MMKISSVGVCFMAVVVVLFGGTELSMAVTCNVHELSPCASAFASPPTPPSAECCTKLKEQEPCFCQYLKDPNLRTLIMTENTEKMGKACHIKAPTC